VRDTKDSIIKAARHLFAQHGYHGTSVDSIVKEAGVSKGSLYWHFSDKFELYRTILILEVERVKELFKSETYDVVDAAAFFRRRGNLILDVFDKDPESTLIWMDLLIQAKRGREEFKKIARDLTSYYMKISMDEGLCFNLDKGEMDSICLLLRLTMLGILSCQGSVMDTQEAKECWEHIVDLVMKGDD